LALSPFQKFLKELLLLLSIEAWWRARLFRFRRVDRRLGFSRKAAECARLKSHSSFFAFDFLDLHQRSKKPCQASRRLIDLRLRRCNFLRHERIVDWLMELLRSNGAEVVVTAEVAEIGFVWNGRRRLIIGLRRTTNYNTKGNVNPWTGTIGPRPPKY
jgi:hypothetical protein